MKYLLIAVLLSLVTGCATVMESNDQSIVIGTVGCEEHGSPTCIAQNKDNAVKVRTPGVLPVEKGAQDLVISCESDNRLAHGSYNAKSTYEAMNLGNLLVGGIIGFGVDAFTGAMWEFPPNIIVDMQCAEGTDVSPPEAESNEHN